MNKNKQYTIKWLSDLHLNFYNKQEREELYRKIKNGRFDSLIITGDIATSDTFYVYLEEMSRHITNKYVYFILGNHDYYSGNIFDCEMAADDFTMFCAGNFMYMPHCSRIALNEEIGLCLVGVNGWADARNGAAENTHIRLNDSIYINDLVEAEKQDRLFTEMRKWADRDATTLRNQLYNLPLWCTQVIVATHVPPFIETCLYLGKQSDKNFLPFFSSKVLGDTILEFAEKFPHIQITSISGHTHGGGEARIRENVIAKTHNSEYNKMKSKLLRFKGISC